MERIPPKGTKLTGRPSGYRKEMDEQVRKLCLLNAHITDVEIAAFFDCSTVTLNTWKKNYPSFLNALKLGKEQADANVGNRLYERAMGYTHPEEKIFVDKDGEVIRVNTLKHYPPDTTACIFWLKNRRPDQWRDRQELTGPNGAPISTPPALVIIYGDKLPPNASKLIEGKVNPA